MKTNKTVVAAAVLVVVSIVYGIVAGVRGHSARAEPPPDLSANAEGLDVWRALAWMAGGAVDIVDVRSSEQYAFYHLPRARSLPDADAAALRATATAPRLLVVAASDADAAKRVSELVAGGATPEARYLKGGAPAWYLALELPVPLFNDKPPPFGWVAAHGEVRRWLESRSPAGAELLRAVELLATAGYEPTGVGQGKKPAAGKAKKKISGGCG
jgi:rhodanese-related sulfurtransferase